jgi:hypothetical protein
MTTPIDPTRIVLTSVEEKNTLQLGHIWINGQRYKVTIEGQNINESLDDSSKMTTLAKAHMIAKAKFKDIKEIQSVTVELGKTVISTKTGSQESSADEEIQEDTVLEKEAKLQSGSTVLEPKKEYFENLKKTIDKGTDTTLKCSHVFNSIIAACNITLPSSRTAPTSTLPPPSSNPSTVSAAPGTLVIERAEESPPPKLPTVGSSGQTRASAAVPPIRVPASPPTPPKSSPTSSSSPSSVDSPSPVEIDSRPTHVQVEELLKTADSNPLNYESIKSKYTFIQGKLRSPSHLLKALITNSDELKRLMTMHNCELKIMQNIATRTTSSSSSPLPGSIDSPKAAREEQAAALKTYKDFLQISLLPNLKREAQRLNKMKRSIPKDQPSFPLLDTHLAHTEHLILKTQRIISNL